MERGLECDHRTNGKLTGTTAGTANVTAKFAGVTATKKITVTANS